MTMVDIEQQMISAAAAPLSIYPRRSWTTPARLTWCSCSPSNPTGWPARSPAATSTGEVNNTRTADPPTRPSSNR